MHDVQGKYETMAKRKLSAISKKKIVLRGIESTKKEYFDRVLVAYICDLKKTWQVISETLNRNKKKYEMPSLFIHEGRDLAGSTKIANAFNIYFANIEKKLSSQIDENIVHADYKQYLTSHTDENLQFKCITEEYIIKLIRTALVTMVFLISY